MPDQQKGKSLDVSLTGRVLQLFEENRYLREIGIFVMESNYWSISHVSLIFLKILLSATEYLDGLVTGL